MWDPRSGKGRANSKPSPKRGLNSCAEGVFTPTRIACRRPRPPTGSILLGLGRFRFWFVLRILAAEAFNAASGVEHLLLTGKERMAGRADFNVDVATIRAARHKT